MKKVIFSLIAIALIVSAAAFTTTGATGSESVATATVQQKEGLYIFIMCKPTTEYKYLGSVKKSLAWTGKPHEMLHSMINKIVKKYPEADGIIYTDDDMSRADAITFKK